MSDDRPIPALTGDERDVACGFLDFHRATLMGKCEGLTPQQLARRAVPPSTLSLLGLVRHLADVEREWFGQVSGAGFTFRFADGADRDAQFLAAAGTGEAVDEAFAAWRESVDHARTVAARTDLDATFDHPQLGAISLRWVLVHMVEEYARHNGHADLLREAVDGRTGA